MLKILILLRRVAFYPAPLMISHSLKPLTFYAETKLLNVHTVFNFTELSGSFTMSNKSCSVPLEKFFDQLLLTVCGFQNVVRWLLSLAGFSTLVECDTFTDVLSVYGRKSFEKVMSKSL